MRIESQSIKGCLKGAKSSGIKMFKFMMDTAPPSLRAKAEKQGDKKQIRKCDHLASFSAASKSTYEGKTKEYKGPKESTKGRCERAEGQ